MPNIQPLIGVAIKGARKIAGIVGAGAKDVHPTYRSGVTIPPPPPGMPKAIDLKNPPKIPTRNTPKEPHVSERRDTAPQNKNPEIPKKSKPVVLPGRGKFTGNLGPYNWTGK